MSNKILIWVGIGVVLLGGAYLLVSKNSAFMPSGDSMMEGEEGAMMDEHDDAMGDDSMMGEDSMMHDATSTGSDSMMQGDESMMMEKGSYESYAPEKLALADSGKVVLFFHADWCPICRPLDAEFNAGGIPDGVHILKVDYDTATALKKKYGVTYQHTFVQVDAQGNLIAKWGDASTEAQVLARIQ